jgi:hypothetical protein
MASMHHRNPGLAALFSVAALATVGCSTEWEPGAEPDDATEHYAAPGLQSTSLSDAQGCDPHAGLPAHWHAAAPMPAARQRHSALLLPDGKVLVGGGSGSTSAFLYNPATDTWTTSAPLPLNTFQTRTALLPDGRVLFSPGGVVYDPSTDTSTSVPLTPGEAVQGWPFDGATLTTLPSGLALRTGGSDEDHDLKEAVLYDPATNTWSSAGTMSATRHLHTATLLADGRVLVVGGYTLEGDYQLPAGRTSVDIYDPTAGTWTAAAPTNMPRMQHTATLLPSGRVLVIGGGGAVYTDFQSDDDGDHWVTIPANVTAEVYDPGNGTWTSTAPPSLAYGPGSAAAQMHQGRVMAIGFYGAEIYEEASDSWSPIEEPTDTQRSFFTATALQDGSVLIAGGRGWAFGTGGWKFRNLASVERYRIGCAPH